MVIEVLNYVERCYSNDDGIIINNIINKALENGNQVVISFKGVNSVTSSFINSAFIELIKNYDLEFVKNQLMFTNSNKSINRMIRDRFAFFMETELQPV